MSTTETGRSLANRGAAPVAPQQPAQVEINDSQTFSLYSNFCRVTGSPEELMIDFGLNPRPFETSGEPIVVRQRIVTNYYTAKRMLHALEMVIQRHEATFGALEVNVERRVVRQGVPGQHAAG